MDYAPSTHSHQAANLSVQEPQRGDEADTTPDVSLLVMWGWGMAQIFAPGALEPDVRYDDRQIFWQRNVCADGVSYVQGVCPRTVSVMSPAMFWLREERTWNRCQDKPQGGAHADEPQPHCTWCKTHGSARVAGICVQFATGSGGTARGQSVHRLGLCTH